MYLHKLNIHIHIFTLRDYYLFYRKLSYILIGLTKRNILLFVAYPCAITLHFQSTRKRLKPSTPSLPLGLDFSKKLLSLGGTQGVLCVLCSLEKYVNVL